MMQRAASRSDLDLVCRGERCRHKDLGVAYRAGEVVPLCQPGRNRRRQGATGAVTISSRNAIGHQARACLALDEKIDALRATGVATLDEHRLRSEGEQALALFLHFLLRAR